MSRVICFLPKALHELVNGLLVCLLIEGLQEKANSFNCTVVLGVAHTSQVTLRQNLVALQEWKQGLEVDKLHDRDVESSDGTHIYP